MTVAELAKTVDRSGNTVKIYAEKLGFLGTKVKGVRIEYTEEQAEKILESIPIKPLERTRAELAKEANITDYSAKCIARAMGVKGLQGGVRYFPKDRVHEFRERAKQYANRPKIDLEKQREELYRKVFKKIKEKGAVKGTEIVKMIGRSNVDSILAIFASYGLFLYADEDLPSKYYPLNDTFKEWKEENKYLSKTGSVQARHQYSMRGMV